MLVTDTINFQQIIEEAAQKISNELSKDMNRLFEESPEIFDGRSTEAEWKSQVGNANEWLEDAISFEISCLVEQAESRLHGGEFLDASVACRRAARVV